MAGQRTPPSALKRGQLGNERSHRRARCDDRLIHRVARRIRTGNGTPDDGVAGRRLPDQDLGVRVVHGRALRRHVQRQHRHDDRREDDDPLAPSEHAHVVSERRRVAELVCPFCHFPASPRAEPANSPLVLLRHTIEQESRSFDTAAGVAVFFRFGAANG